MTVDPDKLRSELAKMRQLIASDPRVLAHFDTDGNGIIDGDEWEEVRRVVIARLQREELEAELARQALADLDPAQAAELARMEAEMSEGGGSEGEPTPQAPGRDWSNLELAFDPRDERKPRSVAEDMYERDLSSRYAGARDPANLRHGERGTMADCDELVLEQVGGAKQLFGNMFRRAYVVRDADGEELGRIGQKQNEALQNLTDYSIFSDPDLDFVVEDGVSGERFQLRRSSSVGDNSISVYNPRNLQVAWTRWSLSFIRRKYEVRAVREGVSYSVRRQLLRPWTFDVLDPFDEPIGEMQRGWSGLGFLTGGNLFHIAVDEPLAPEVMWGLLATALLADLDSEPGSRKSALDFFNE